MFWTILLYVYLGISVLSFIMLLVTACDAKRRFIWKYGEQAREDIPHLSSWPGAIIRALVGCFMPLFHIVLLIGFTFMSERIIPLLVDDLVKDYIKD